MFKRTILFGLCVLCVLSMGTTALAARVAVTPFAIYSQDDLAYLSQGIQEMVNSHLLNRGVQVVSPGDVARVLGGRNAANLDEKTARNLGRALKADSVVYGSLTKVGRRISLDARVVDVSGRKKTGVVFLQEEGLENLMMATERLAQEATGTVSGRQRIADIQIEGNDRIEDDAIRRVLTIQAGDPYSESQVAQELKTIYGLDYFEDVRVDVSDSPAGKVVKFIVDEKPVVSQIDFTGNRMVDREKLEEVLGYNLYTILKPRDVIASVDNLRGLYREKGYYNAKIEYELEPLGEKRVGVRYQIDEGSRLYIRNIEFLGNEYYSDWKLRRELETKTRGILSWVTDTGILKKDVLNNDVESIQQFYYNNGFIHSRVGEPQVEIDEDGINIKIPVVEGPRFEVGEVGVDGDLIYEKEEIIDELKIRKEKYFNREIMRQDVGTIRDMYANKGYALVRIKPESLEHADKAVVDIIYQIEKNVLVSFERVSIMGNDKTMDKVIRRELEFNEGDLFSAEKLRQSNVNLYKLGYFDDVELLTSKGSADNKMDIKIKVKERPTGAFSFGAGYSTYNQVFGMISISQDNLFGTGRKLKVQATLGGRSEEYVLSFTEPWLFDRRITAGFDVFLRSDDYDTYTRRGRGFALRGGYPLWEAQKVRLSGRYMLEEIEVTDFGVNVAQSIADLEGTSLTSSLAFQVRRDTKNRVFNPTEGSDNVFAVTYAGGVLGGDNHFVKYTFDSGWFLPTPLQDVTLFARGKIGYMSETKKDGLPIYEKFFLGGMDSVRGYKWSSISPRDPLTNDRLGGEKMALFNVELIFPLIKSAGIMGVAFFDQGNVWTSDQDYDFGDLKRGYGAGIRYYSPMGPLRLEYGRALDAYPGENEEVWEFSVGTFF
jgi:outer membrane protein insertion porin family